MSKTIKIGGNTFTFAPEWIKNGADADMIKFAEATARDIQRLNRTQFRNIYSEIKRIQSNYNNNVSAVYLLKPKVAYACGRADKWQRPMLLTFKNVFDAAIDEVTDKATYDNFCNLMEAILAYHRCFSENK